MKRIKQIFDGEYGCEERTADERLKYWSSWRMKTGQESSPVRRGRLAEGAGAGGRLRVAGELAEVKRIWRKAGQYEKSAGHPVKNTESPADFPLMSYISSECNCQY